MRKKHAVLAALLLLALLPVKASCEEQETVNLSILYSGADVTWVAAMEELCEAFMSQNPEIVIYTENSDKTSCEDELKVKEALNEFPDIFELENVDAFVEAGKLGVLGDEISEKVSDPVRVNGQVYGLPIYASTDGIIYNKELFKKYGLEVPKSYGEFLQVCETLKRNGVVPLALGGNKDENMMYWLNYFFQKDVISESPDWLEQKKDGAVSFTDPEPIRMLTEYQRLVTSSYILEDSVDLTENQLVMKMVENEFAMLYAGPWMFAKIIATYPDSISSDKTELGEEIAEEDDPVTYRLGWFFVGDEEGNTTALTENYAYWAVSGDCMKDPDKRAAAEAFLEYFYQKENYRMMIQGVYGLPVTSEAIIYPAPFVQQRLLVDYRYAEKSQEYLGAFGVKGGFSTDVNSIMRTLYEKGCTPEEAAVQMDQAWDEAMEEVGRGQ